MFTMEENVTPITTEIQSVDKNDVQNVTSDVTPNVTPDKIALRVKNLMADEFPQLYID